MIQTFDRSTYGADPATWRQPIDQYDSYKLVNAFTGEPDECIHAGKTWRTKVDNNVWEPGVGGTWAAVS